MRVTPKTEKEIYEADLLPDGWYPFTIAKAEEKVSKKGNEMIVANVKVYRGEGFSFVKDYLMDTEFGAKKLRSLAVTAQLLDEYTNGSLPAADLDGKEGYCKIGRERSKDPQYPDKNKILEYSHQPTEGRASSVEAKPLAQPSARQPEPASDEPQEDDIPF